MTYKVVFSCIFEDDLDTALEYISRKLYNPGAAQRLLNKVSDMISLLEENPLTFPLYHDDMLAKQGLRYIVISNYLLFYKVDELEKSVIFSRFIFGDRNIASLF